MLQPGLSFVLDSVCSSSHIHRTSGVGEPLIAPFVTQGHWASARLLARLNPAAVLAPNIGCCHAPTGVNARSKLPSSGDCAPIRSTAIQRQSTRPLVFLRQSCLRKQLVQKCRKMVNPIRSLQALHLSIPTARKHIPISPFAKSFMVTSCHTDIQVGSRRKFLDDFRDSTA